MPEDSKELANKLDQVKNYLAQTRTTFETTPSMETLSAYVMAIGQMTEQLLTEVAETLRA
jgi:hypothetical protein